MKQVKINGEWITPPAENLTGWLHEPIKVVLTPLLTVARYLQRWELITDMRDRKITIKKKGIMDKQELIKEIIRLESEINKKEEELAAICEKEIQPLISAKKYQDAKRYVFDFYRDCVDERGNSISIEKDVIVAKLNSLINNKKL